MNDFISCNIINSILMIIILISRKMGIKSKNQRYTFLLWGLLIVSLLLPFKFQITEYIIDSSTPILYSAGVVERSIDEFSSGAVLSSTKNNINYLEFVYYSGVLIFILNFLLKNVYLVKILKQKEVQNIVLKNRLSRISDSKAEIIIIKNIDVTSCTKGILRPKIYVNERLNEYDDAKLLAILRHEEAHISYKHNFILTLVNVLEIMYWFNPLIYMIKNAIIMDMEHQADKNVLDMKILNFRDYFDLLINESSNNVRYELNFSSGYRQLYERINNMNKENKCSKIFFIALVFTVMIASVYAHVGFEKEIVTGTSNSKDISTIINDQKENEDLINEKNNVAVSSKNDGLYISSNATEVYYLTGSTNAKVLQEVLSEGVEDRDLYVLDVHTAKYDNVYSFTDGEIVFIGNGGALEGRSIIIKANDGTYYGYAHLSAARGTIKSDTMDLDDKVLNIGDIVSAGEVIGKAGRSGGSGHDGYAVVNFKNDEKRSHLDMKSKFIFTDGIQVLGDPSYYAASYNPNAVINRIVFFENCNLD